MLFYSVFKLKLSKQEKKRVHFFLRPSWFQQDIRSLKGENKSCVNQWNQAKENPFNALMVWIRIIQWANYNGQMENVQYKEI